jgi:hypothetical protein
MMHGGPRRLALWVLWLYPRHWRARYGDEMADVLRVVPVTPLTLVDLVVGAADAYLRADLVPRRILTMTHRLRTSAILFFCAFMLFVVAGIPLGRVADPGDAWQAATSLHPELGTLLSVAIVAAELTVLAVGIGGLPIGLSALKDGIVHRRRSVLVPLGAAAAIVVVWLVVSAITFAVAASRPGTGVRPLRPVDIALSLIWLLFSALGTLAGTTLVGLAISHSEVSGRVLRLARIPASLAGLGMLATLGATAALYFRINTVAPALQQNQDTGGIILLGMIGMMALATLAAGVALWRAYRANGARIMSAPTALA